jgi:hypothetical protein
MWENLSFQRSIEANKAEGQIKSQNDKGRQKEGTSLGKEKKEKKEKEKEKKRKSSTRQTRETFARKITKESGSQRKGSV